MITDSLICIINWLKISCKERDGLIIIRIKENFAILLHFYSLDKIAILLRCRHFTIMEVQEEASLHSPICSTEDPDNLDI